MPLEPGATLFQRGQDEEEDSDIWDDTALIKAYDSAINVMKTRFGETPCAEPPAPQAAAKKKKKHKKNRRNKSQKDSAQKEMGSKWRIGSRCRAIFTDDGQLYDAVLVSINQDTETGVIRYVNYGNEEEHELEDLLPPRKAPQDRMLSESDGGMDWSHTPRVPAAPTIPPIMSAPPPTLPAWPTALTPGGFTAGMPTPPMPPLIPPCGGAMSSNQLPGLCVPPIGAIKGLLDAGGDDSAMYSMLLSWYMSGYHTGYYQGLMEAKKKVAAKQSPLSVKVPKMSSPKAAEENSFEHESMDKSR